MSVRTRYLATTLALLAIGLGFGLSQWRATAIGGAQAARAGTPRRRPARPAQPPTARGGPEPERRHSSCAPSRRTRLRDAGSRSGRRTYEEL